MTDKLKTRIKFIICLNFLWILNFQLFEFTLIKHLPYAQVIQGIQAAFLLLIQLCLYFMIKENNLKWVDWFEFSLLFIIIFSGYFNVTVFFTSCGIFLYYTFLRWMVENNVKNVELPKISSEEHEQEEISQQEKTSDIKI